VRRALALAFALSLLATPHALSASADGAAEGRQIHLGQPTWILPGWTADGPSVWTEIGAPYAASVALVGPDGSFAPRNHGPAVSFWLYDLDAGSLLAPSEHDPRVRLDDNYLPIVTSSWAAADLHVETTLFSTWPNGDVAEWFREHGAGSEKAVTFVRLTVTTTSETPRHLAWFAAVRPFGIERDMHPIGTATCQADAATLVADSALVLVGAQPASECGATSLAAGDASAFALRDRLPDASAVSDPAGRAESMLRVAITATAATAASVEFRSPSTRTIPTPDQLAALTSASFEQQRGRVATAWRDAVRRTTFDVSDTRFNDAFRASQVYLLLNRRGALPRSGPLAHDAFWVRDAAYIGQAMERVGYAVENQATLEALASTQVDDGSFPAITDASGARPVQEWDAEGEAIQALVAHYRFGRDLAWLTRVYPPIARAARFQDALRGRTLNEDPETRALLPANASAEDLGPAAWHHYWDDLWAVAGYREAAFAAREVGESTDAADFLARADDLQATLLHSIALVQARTGKLFIPNGPEDVLSSAMARGTTPAVWPVRSLHGLDSLALLQLSFRGYYQTFMAPQGGGYIHYAGTLWPYGGLGIAHATLRLGLLDETWQVLDWTINHPTLPGTYAWGEAVSPQNGGLELGDMPHSWAAAELISLLRDVIVSEQDGVLLVNPGSPASWLEAGKHIQLRDAPTEYGPVSVSLVRDAAASGDDQPDLTIQLDGAPPRGWQVRLPGRPVAVLVDGVPVPVQPDVQTLVPSGAHTLLVHYR
jgi:hypothetical protein